MSRVFSFSRNCASQSIANVLDRRSWIRRVEINAEDLYIDTESGFLGLGAFGTVYRGTFQGLDAAVKLLAGRNGQLNLTDSQKYRFYKEVEKLQKKKGKYIVDCYGCVTDKYLIVTELFEKGSLSDVMQDEREKERVTNMRQRLKWIEQGAEALVWMNCVEPRMTHRDFKPQNLFVDENYCLKLGDLGQSRLVDILSESRKTLETSNLQGSVYYMLYQGPEVMEGRDTVNGEYLDASDMYSFGVFIQEMLTLKLPYGMKSLDESEYWRIYNGVRNGRIRPEVSEDRSDLPGIWHPCLEPLVELMRHCTEFHPSDRPRDFKCILSRVKEVRREYERFVRPVACSARKIWMVALTIILVLIVGGFALGIVCTAKHGRPSLELAAAYVILFLLAVFIVIGLRSLKSKDFSLKSVRENISRNPRAESGGFEMKLTDCHRSASDRSYDMPDNWKEVVDQLLIELSESSECLYVKEIRRLCKLLISHDEPMDSKKWDELIATCLKSPIARETQAWSSYEATMNSASPQILAVNGQFGQGPSTSNAAQMTFERGYGDVLGRGSSNALRFQASFDAIDPENKDGGASDTGSVLSDESSTSTLTVDRLS